jgi:hypothetical protein
LPEERTVTVAGILVNNTCLGSVCITKANFIVSNCVIKPKERRKEHPLLMDIMSTALALVTWALQQEIALFPFVSY